MRFSFFSSCFFLATLYYQNGFSGKAVKKMQVKKNGEKECVTFKIKHSDENFQDNGNYVKLEDTQDSMWLAVKIAKRNNK